MRYNKCRGFNVYNVVVLSTQLTYLTKEINKKLKKFCNWIEKPKKTHITLKYLGYFENYKEKEILRLIPKIKKISIKYMPLKIRLLSINIFENKEQDLLSIFIKVKKSKKLREFHYKLKYSLKPIDHFTFQEGHYYSPHITLAHAKIKNKEKIVRLIEKIKFKEREIIFDKLGIYLKRSIKII